MLSLATPSAPLSGVYVAQCAIPSTKETWIEPAVHCWALLKVHVVTSHEPTTLCPIPAIGELLILLSCSMCVRDKPPQPHDNDNGYHYSLVQVICKRQYCY